MVRVVLSLTFAVVPTWSVLAQGFTVAPYATDALDENAARDAAYVPTFSPNGDGSQDSAFVVFVTGVLIGSYRVVIDTRGPGGVGGPDGTFSEADDWVSKGAVQSMPKVRAEETTIAVSSEWDGAVAWGSTQKVAEGTYKAQIAIDSFDNKIIDVGATTAIVQITVDTTAPVVSLRVGSLSPNGDGSRDSTTVSYASSETPVRLDFALTAGPIRNTPAISRPSPLTKTANITWVGTDTAGAALPEGNYTLEAAVTDIGGNVGKATGDFTVDVTAPELASITPANGARLNAGVTEFVAMVNAGTGSALDFDASGTGIALTSPSGAPVAGTLIIDRATNTLRLQLGSSLTATAGNGVYTATVTAVDKAGNRLAKTSSFTLDTVAPVISAVTTGSGKTIAGDEIVALKTTDSMSFAIVESGTGVNFATASVRLTSPSGVDVPVSVSETAPPLAVVVGWSNLSENGRYTLTVQNLADVAGNVGKQRSVPFYHDLVAPVLTSLTHVDLAGGTSRVSQPPDAFAAKVQDAVSGIDFGATSLSLTKAGGSTVPATLENDGVDTVTLRPSTRFALTGADDGSYTLAATIVDKAGNRLARTFPIVYDSQPPRVVSTTPAAGSVVSEALSQARVTLSDATSGVDLSGTIISLLAPGGAALSVTARPTDDTTITISFDPLKTDGSADGVYALQIVARDRAGNVAGTIRREFTVKTGAPRIVSVTPANRGYVSALTSVSATLSGASNGSRIEVTGPDGRALVGASTFADGVLAFTPQPALATDGRDDGVYTARITPTNAVGTSGETGTFTFTYDTQVPEIQSVSQMDLTAAESFAKGTISRITATLNDTLTGIDTTTSQIRVRTKGGSEVVGSQTTDGKSAVSWQLATPLVPGGAQDGVYAVAVTARDRAGNRQDRTYTLVYDTVAPALSSTTPAASVTIASALSEVRAEVRDAVSGVNFESSRLELTGPRGVVNATQRADGNALVLGFLPLRTNGADDGTYTINVTLQDRAGNSATRSVPFYVITRGLRIVSTTPAAGSTVNELRTVQAVLEERSGAGLDLDASTLELLNAASASVPGRISRAGSTLTFTTNAPFSTDGSDDGSYTIRVTAVDALGNRIEDSRVVALDTLVPTVASTKPAANATVSEPLSEITIQLADDGSGPDLMGSQVIVKGPTGNTVPANRRASGDTLTVTFSPLTAAGAYSVEIVPRDLAGNAAESAIRIPFTVVVLPPRVVSLAIGSGSTESSYRRELREIKAGLQDLSGSGLDLREGASSVRVTGPRGVVAGRTTASGTTLTWTPILPLATDGTDDGNYTIAVTPVDLGGRTGTTVERAVVYDSRPPRVTAISPASLSLALSYIGQSITQAEATLVDDGQSGLDLAQQSVRLLGPNGSTVAGRATTDGTSRVGWQLTSPLPTDGSADGEYRVVVSAVDRAGNTGKWEYAIAYDTQAPTLVRSVPESGGTLATNALSIVVTLSDRGTSGIDFAATTATLLAPTGSAVSGIVSNDSASTLTFTFAEDLTQDGTHTLRLSMADRAGNRRSTDLSFFHAANIPTVASTAPKTYPVDEAFAPKGLAQVTATLQATNNGGISLSPIHTEIRLTDNSGNTVAGTQSSSGNATLVYRLAKPLADDGSDDGTYRIVVTPANAAGKRGVAKTFTFVYDSQSPRIVSNSLQTLYPSSGSTQSVAGFSVDIRDMSPASGIDWDNVDDSWMVLQGPDGKPLDGSVSGDGSQSLALILTRPLASDGSQDGAFTLTIAPLDRAGNETVAIYEFELDTKAPTVDVATLTLNDRPVMVDTNSLEYPTSVNSESGITLRVKISDDGAGADLARSTISVVSPQGAPISGTTRQNGTDTLEFISGALADQGIYRVQITAVGLDVHGLGIQPSRTAGATFLYEKTAPVAAITNAGGTGVFESKPAHIAGTASDTAGTTGGGNQQLSVTASGVALVEIGGTGPDGEELAWEAADDESTEQQKAWAQWSADFLPSRSGKYRLAVRVTDRAGNTNIVDVGTLEFTTALAFKGPVYSWPSPLHRDADTAHFSFETNQAEGARVTLSIYDVAGTLLFSRTVDASRERTANSQAVTWDLSNRSGTRVASGIYVWQVEVDDGSSKVRRMGRLVVVR